MAEDTRDRQSMGASRSLATTPYQINYTYGRPVEGIVRGTGADWFGPLNPLSPIAPPDVKGRILDFMSGYNLNVQPRTNEAITFPMLRAFADSYDLLRLVIETRKDQLARLKWTISPTEHATKSDEELKDKVREIELFLRRPDRVHFWDEWLRMVLEDLFVLDAPSIHRRKTYGGDLYSLEPIDGGTIKRVIDDWGRTPEYPIPAYQQVLKGYPAVDYTTRDLLYKPRNIRTHKVYGYGPVEQIIMTVNIGLRRQTWQLESFTAGNIPEALIGTPDTWTPDQIKTFQVWFDSMLEGNTAERRRARFVPGAIAKGYMPTKPTELFGEAEEWLARVVCFAFSISPQPFLKMMNRATAETAQETAVSEGLAPVQNWVKGLIDTIIMDDFGETDLEFMWAEEDELDPGIKSQIIDREVGSGLLTMNDGRREKGLAPYTDPEADRPMLRTASGYVPVYLTPEEKKQKEEMAAAIANGDGPPPPGTKKEDDPEANTEADVEVADVTEDDEGVAEKSDRPFGVAGADGLKKAVAKQYVDPDRKKIIKIKSRLATRLHAVLVRLGVSVSSQIETILGKLAKADDEPEFEWGDIDIEDVLNQLDLDIILDAEEALSDAMKDTYKDSGKEAIAQIGAKTSDDIVNVVNDRAVEWAENNAAELVGLGDGEYSLSHATRDMLRTTISDGLKGNLSNLQIAEEIKNTYAFSEERAELIAMTEIASANSHGALAGYEEVANQGVKVRKSWLILEDACDICHENEDAGVIELDEQFPSGDDAPPAHPHCRCVLVPEVEDSPAEKLDNRDDMAQYFPVVESLRDPIWAMGGSEEATKEREAALLQFVPFDQCVATQVYCDHDKVNLYIADPTAKGFAPMVHKIGDRYAIQDGHHRAVASKLSGNRGMSMNVREI